MAEATLKERLAEELRAALKARQAVRLSTLRLLSAAVKNREVELRREVSDQEFLEVVAREAKRRREAIDAYESAGRPDRAATEREELAVLEAFL
ncbi:MAG TPA: GatB/YqeY domain-containing protein, partial [Actinomycetota bacterium]|nr:GatB/YqeY domain-containing protein [Actinomycetota bacterium]